MGVGVLPASIRLEPLDMCRWTGRYKRQARTADRVLEVRPARRDWELEITLDGGHEIPTGVGPREIPDQVVKSRPEVLDRVSEYERQSNGGLRIRDHHEL